MKKERQRGGKRRGKRRKKREKEKEKEDKNEDIDWMYNAKNDQMSKEVKRL